MLAELVEVSPTYLVVAEAGKAGYSPAVERVRRTSELLETEPDQAIALAGRMPEAVTKLILRGPSFYAGTVARGEKPYPGHLRN